jgi:hypothetical protein
MKVIVIVNYTIIIKTIINSLTKKTLVKSYNVLYGHFIIHYGF